jgi:hypothetical protein
MWTIQRNTKSDEKSDSILEIKNRFRSDGIGKSKLIYLYAFIPKLIGLVNHNQAFP